MLELSVPGPSTGSVYQRGTVWWITYRKDGRRIRESSRSRSRETAEALLRLRTTPSTLAMTCPKCGETAPGMLTIAAVDPALVEKFRREFEKLWRTPTRVVPLLPADLFERERDVIVAAVTGHISAGRARELLGWDIQRWRAQTKAMIERGVAEAHR